MTERDPILDRPSAIARLAGDADLYEEIAAMAAVDLPENARALVRAGELQDAALVMRHSHAIKGLAASLGAQSLRSQAADLEQRARRKDAAYFPEAVAAILKSIDQVLAALRR